MGNNQYSSRLENTKAYKGSLYLLCPDGRFIPTTESARYPGRYIFHMYDTVNLLQNGWYIKYNDYTYKTPDFVAKMPRQHFDTDETKSKSPFFTFVHPFEGAFTGKLTRGRFYAAWSREDF